MLAVQCSAVQGSQEVHSGPASCKLRGDRVETFFQPSFFPTEPYCSPCSLTPSYTTQSLPLLALPTDNLARVESLSPPLPSLLAIVRSHSFPSAAIRPRTQLQSLLPVSASTPHHVTTSADSIRLQYTLNYMSRATVAAVY